mmetsp:Transcript_25916/g.64015  ORF Transcript_25916/g.64015 Transcript_25916/m.64015 type:complete len:208 (-) Transcript_25916:103-726(-)
MGLLAREAARLLAEVASLHPGQAGASQQGAPKVSELCGLWGGMGSVYLLNSAVVLKRVNFPRTSSLGDVRKIESYRAEVAFYERHASRLLSPPHSLGLPRPLLTKMTPGGVDICMTALRGQSAHGSISRDQSFAALDWLAGLHAAYWGILPTELDGLQPQGSYWYLDTRPEELEAMPRSGWEARLRLAAVGIDARLKVLLCLIRLQQ